MNNVTGIILAGGLSRRFGGGGDKFQNKLSGRPLLEWVVERARPQVGTLILNANSDADQFDHYNLPVIADVIQGYAGPLAGVLTGMEWVRANQSDRDWIATFPADAPFIPTDMVDLLLDRAEQDKSEIACAASGGWSHPVCGLWRVELADQLRQAIEIEDMRKTDLWTSRYKLSTIEFSTDPFDPFYNVNQPSDLEEAEKIADLWM